MINKIIKIITIKCNKGWIIKIKKLTIYQIKIKELKIIITFNQIFMIKIIFLTNFRIKGKERILKLFLKICHQFKKDTCKYKVKVIRKKHFYKRGLIRVNLKKKILYKMIIKKIKEIKKRYLKNYQILWKIMILIRWIFNKDKILNFKQ